MIIIRSIDLSKEVPLVKFTSFREDGSSQDSVFPGREGDRMPPRDSFETAVTNLENALQDSVFELGADDDRAFNLKSVTIKWSEEHDEYGYSVKYSSFKSGSPKIDMTITEDSPDHVDERVYAALQVLLSEAKKYAQGESAQFNLFDQSEDAEPEDDESDQAGDDDAVPAASAAVKGKVVSLSRAGRNAAKAAGGEA